MHVCEQMCLWEGFIPFNIPCIGLCVCAASLWVSPPSGMQRKDGGNFTENNCCMRVRLAAPGSSTQWACDWLLQVTAPNGRAITCCSALSRTAPPPHPAHGDYCVCGGSSPLSPQDVERLNRRYLMLNTHTWWARPLPWGCACLFCLLTSVTGCLKQVDD